MFSGSDYHTEVAAMIKGTDEVFSDKFSMHFFELKKVGKKPNPNNSCELWLQFINADNEEALNMIRQTDIPIMKKAVNVIYDMSEDTRIREFARMREKALHDEASAMKNARAEGMAKGLEKGAANKEAEIIANMKALGMSDEQISRIISGTNQ